jgi:hypothetical protein
MGYGVISIQKDQLSYDKSDRMFTVEASDMRTWPRMAPTQLHVRNDITEKVQLFVLKDIDTYGPEEDQEIAGWRYFCPSMNIRLLIIND